MKMVFNEFYGEIPSTLNTAIKRYKVTPSEFQDLESQYGSDFAAIKNAIVTFSQERGTFNHYRWMQDIGAAW